MKKHMWLALFVLAAASLGAGSALADGSAYLRLKGQKTGRVEGGVAVKGLEGMILVTAVSHEIVSPRDPASGLPTGKRQHKPLVVTIPVDKSAPKLLTMLANNESIPEFELKFYRPVGGQRGGDGLYYTVKLTGANLASIHTRLLNTENPELVRYPLYQEVAFTYQKIELIWADGNIGAQDAWEAPVN